MRKGLDATYAMNVQYCLALQQIGGARAEADVVTIFKNLPYGATMQHATTKKVEDQLGKLMYDIGKKEMQNLLKEEVLEHLIEEGREGDFEK